MSKTFVAMWRIEIEADDMSEAAGKHVDALSAMDDAPCSVFVWGDGLTEVVPYEESIRRMEDELAKLRRVIESREGRAVANHPSRCAGSGEANSMAKDGYAVGACSVCGQMIGLVVSDDGRMAMLDDHLPFTPEQA